MFEILIAKYKRHYKATKGWRYRQVFGKERGKKRLTEIEKQRVGLEFGILGLAIEKEKLEAFKEVGKGKGAGKFSTTELSVQNFANAWGIGRNQPNNILNVLLQERREKDDAEESLSQNTERHII